MRRLTLLAPVLAGTIALAACDEDDRTAPTTPASVGDQLRAYIADDQVGRAALEESLVVRDNGYAALRLANYTPDRWRALPEYDPRTTPVRFDRGTGAPSPPPAVPARGEADSAGNWSSTLPNKETFDPTDEALLRLGERAFFAYPAQEARGVPEVLAAPDHAGVWSQNDRLGVVWMASSTGPRGAYTCASCHASTDAATGALVAGRNNANLDAGKLSAGEDGPRWGLGRVDVTSDDADNPVVITDLRPTRWQHRLQHAATVRLSPVALAVRIETLIITSNGEAVRPPRAIAAGLAMYLLSLGTETPRSELALDAEERRGEAVFAATCAHCHAGEGASGESVALSIVGTDASVGASRDRGTGGYRVPSLRHVGDRRLLFATGAVANIDALLEPTPARRSAGHTFGLDLAEPDRAALVRYLHRL